MTGPTADGVLAADSPRTVRRERTLRWVSTGVRLALAAVFIIAGSLKVADPQGSVQAVAAYELLPAWAEAPVGWGLPFAEIALGLVLAAGLKTRAAAIVALAVLATFIGAVISAWTRNLSIDCGCFGGGGPIAAGQAKYGSEIVRDLGFALLAIWLVVRPRSAVSLDHLHDDPELADEPAFGPDLLQPGPAPEARDLDPHDPEPTSAQERTS